MQLLSPEIANVFYDRIIDAHSETKLNRIDAISRIRRALDSCYKHLTERETRSFSTLFQRMEFVQSKYQLSSMMAGSAHSLRIYGNKVIHNTIKEVTEREYSAAVKSFSELIHYFSSQKPPNGVDVIFASQQDLALPGQSITNLVPDVAQARLLVFEKPISHTRQDGRKIVILKCKDQDGQLGEFDLVLRSTTDLDFEYVADCVWQYAIIFVRDIAKNPDKERSYQTTDSTKLIIEPDYLLDATDLAAANTSHPLMYIVSKLVGSVAGPPAFQGTVVGNILDDKLIAEDDFNFMEMYRSAVKEKGLTAIYHGASALREVYTTIQRHHLPQIAAFVQSHKEGEKLIEPTFFSSQYGIQGRLDVLIQDTENEERKDIVELKSGKCPMYGAWPDNIGQVVCYNLLLRSTYGKRIGNSSVMYSRDQNYLRDVSSTKKQEHAILKTRNQIAFTLHELACGRLSSLRDISSYAIENIPTYKKKDVDKFFNVYHSASKETRAYYNAVIMYILRELRATKIGADTSVDREGAGFSNLWLGDVSTKKSNYNILCDLKVMTVDTENAMVTLQFAEESTEHNFREGDLGILYPKINGEYKALAHPILKGNIKAVNKTSVVFTFNNKQTHFDFFNRHEEWAIEHDFFESNYWSQAKTALNLLEYDDRTRSILLGMRKPEQVALGFPVEVDNDPDGIKKECIVNALQAKDYYLLQGPPGTGKTSSFLTQVVTHASRDQKQRCVVLAFTNRAVSEICENLRTKGIDYIRLGRSGTDDDNLFQNRIKDKGHNPDDWASEIEESRILVSTVATFMNRWRLLISRFHFETLIADEASQLTEADLAGLMVKFNKTILIGDQNQLPAVSLQSEALRKVNNETLTELGVVNMGQSLFERMFRQCDRNGWDHAIGQLQQHYRMHADIAELIKHHYSKPLISAGDGPTGDPPFIPASFREANPAFNRRVVFVDSVGGQANKRHPEEAEAVAGLAVLMSKTFDDNFGPEDIGIITPFRAQIIEIKKHLPDDLREQIVIDTVERFQGSGKRVIILSTVITRPGQLRSIESLDLEGKVDRKLLVAISRAKEQLIIFGNPDALWGSERYADLMRRIQEIN